MIEKIIHIEGIDKTGKDSIKDKLVQMSEGKYLILVRSYLSQIAYSNIYNRKININFFLEKAKKCYNDNEIFIFLNCNSKKLKERFIQNNEKDLNIKDIENHKKIFKKIKNLFIYNNIQFIEIDTSYKTIEQCCLEIINRIGR